MVNISPVEIDVEFEENVDFSDEIKRVKQLIVNEKSERI